MGYVKGTKPTDEWPRGKIATKRSYKGQKGSDKCPECERKCSCVFLTELELTREKTRKTHEKVVRASSRIRRARSNTLELNM